MQFSPQDGNVTAFAPSDAVGLDLPCAAGRLGLQSAPSALPRALGFEPQRQEISNTPRVGALLIWYRWWGSNPHGVATGGF